MLSWHPTRGLLDNAFDNPKLSKVIDQKNALKWAFFAYFVYLRDKKSGLFLSVKFQVPGP